MNTKTFSEKTQARMDTLKQSLKDTDRSILLLQGFAENKRSLKNKGYTLGAENYRRTKADDERLVWTLSNLKTQIQRYQHELKILQEYGN